MILNYLEAPINASINAILDFLERENQFISPFQNLNMKNGEDLTVNYHCRRNNNEIGIYSYVYVTPTGKLGPRDYLDDPSGPGNKVIGFEVLKIIDDPRQPPRSLIKGMYDANNDVHKWMFLVRWVKLAEMFGAEWVGTAQKRLDDFQNKGSRDDGLEKNVTNNTTVAGNITIVGDVKNLTVGNNNTITYIPDIPSTEKDQQ